jgi:circadian clock protein KaiC
VRKRRSIIPERDLTLTGVKGFDEILAGGLLRGSITLAEGGAGTGKTTLGVEFVYRGATEFDEPGIIVLFEVTPDKLVRDAALFGWDLRELERQERLKIIFTTRQVFLEEIQQADSLLLAEATAMGARRIFVDGLVRRTADGDGPRNRPESFHLLAEGLQREHLTAILGVEVATPEDAQIGALVSEEFIADTIVRRDSSRWSGRCCGRSRSSRRAARITGWAAIPSGSSTAEGSRCTAGCRRRAS